jgi:hypothetical protein
MVRDTAGYQVHGSLVPVQSLCQGKMTHKKENRILSDIVMGLDYGSGGTTCKNLMAG